MHFQNAHGIFVYIPFISLRHPCIIRPRKAGQIINYRGVLRSLLAISRIGICFQKCQTALCLYFIFVIISYVGHRDKQFKDSRIPKPSHLMKPAIPMIEISNHTDTHGIGCPHRKQHAVDTVYHIRMCSKQMINFIMNTCIEFFRILLGYNRSEGIRIIKILGRPIFHRHCVTVFFRGNRLGYQNGKKAFFISHFHRIIFILCMKHCLYRTRIKDLRKFATANGMYPKYFVRIILF